ncbi:hypothetical protein QL093DRAFT_2153801, partial [Fusarium oxysporum]
MMRGEIPSRHHRAFGQRRLAKNPNLQRKLEQMALPLAPLVQLTTGAVHPSFPTTVLNFWLLTDEQLESLAHFYHQRTPSPWTNQYPCPVTWRSDLPLERSDARWASLSGLRGCESPILLKTEEEILAEARKARLAAEEDLWRRKTLFL